MSITLLLGCDKRFQCHLSFTSCNIHIDPINMLLDPETWNQQEFFLLRLSLAQFDTISLPR